MRFLVDVNASGRIAQWLIDHGYDVHAVADVDGRMSDDSILQWANREQRIIITTDRDFESMIWRERRPHCGLLRLANVPRQARLELLEYVLAHHAGDLESGAVVIAQVHKVRVRRPNRL